MTRPYSNKELRVLAARIMAGGHMDYQDAADFADEFYRLVHGSDKKHSPPKRLEPVEEDLDEREPNTDLTDED